MSSDYRLHTGANRVVDVTRLKFVVGLYTLILSAYSPYIRYNHILPFTIFSTHLFFKNTI